jgi:chromosome segregation ATPase
MIEALFDWIPIFGGVAIGLLAIVLIASERASKTKRHDVQSSAGTLGRKDAAARSEILLADEWRDPKDADELVEKNRQLVGEITVLRSKLETSQRTIEIVQTRLRSLENKASQSDEAAQRHLEELEAMTNQMQSGDGFGDSEQLREEAVAQNSQLEAEITSLRAEILKRSRVIAQTEALHSEEEAHDDKKAELEATQRKLNEMTQQYEALQNENGRLREEIAELKAQLASSASDRQRFKTVQQWLNDLQLKHETVTNFVGEIQSDLTRFRELLKDEPEQRRQLGSLARVQLAESTLEKKTKPTESIAVFQSGRGDKPQDS